MNREPHYLQAELLGRAIGMQGFDRLVHLCHYLMECSDVRGDVVEFGCHLGDTAVLLGAVTHKLVWVYDSFQGLPEPTPQEHSANPSSCFKGSMVCQSIDVVNRFVEADVQPPMIVSGFFHEAKVFPGRIAFAHIDADLASSTFDALKIVYDLMSPEACCVIDDYGDPQWCGAQAGVDKFMADKPEKVVVPVGLHGTPSHHCYFRKSAVLT